MSIVSVGEVHAAWPEKEPPHNLNRFLKWYHAYLASLNLHEHDHKQLVSKEIDMWIDVCMRMDTLEDVSDTRVCDLQ